MRTEDSYNRVFSEATVRRAVEPQTPGQIDRVLLLPLSYSMGFMLGTDPVGLYGFRAGQAFGHVGLSNILAWADPERDIAVALMNSGKPLFALDTAYWPEIVRRISTRIPRDGGRFLLTHETYPVTCLKCQLAQPPLRPQTIPKQRPFVNVF